MFIRMALLIMVFSYPSGLMAAQGMGSLEASILNPRTMDLKELKKLCKEEPQTTACELYQDKIEDLKKNKQSSYPVYTANFQ